MATVRCTPNQSYLGDAYTKEIAVIAKILNKILAFGYHMCSEVLYVETTNCPGTLPVTNSARSDIEVTLIAAAFQNHMGDANISDNKPIVRCSET